MRKLTVTHESWPIAGRFTISRGSKTSAEVVVVTLEEDGAVGRGECVPYARYGETLEGVMAALEAARPRIEAGAGRGGNRRGLGAEGAGHAPGAPARGVVG